MVSKRIFSRLTFCAGVSAEGGSLDPEQLETARNIIAKPGCVHSLWSAAGAGKSYVLAVLLADWAKKAAATSLAFFVTGRRRHRDPILALLRQLLPPQAIWVLARDSETPDPSTQLQAGAEGHARDRLASILDRLEDLDEKIDAVGPAEVSALALHAERVMVLFCHYLWKQRSFQIETINATRVVVATSDLARKKLHRVPWWAQGRTLDLLLHDEVENSTFTELASLSAHFAFVITAGDSRQRLERAAVTCRGMPAADPESGVQAPEANLPLRPIHLSAVPFLKQHATNHSLRTVRRWSSSVGDLLLALGEDEVQCRCTHETSVSLIQLQGNLWDDVGLQTAVTCVFGQHLFALLTNTALAWLQAGPGTVALIFLYRRSVEILNEWKHGLPTDLQGRLIVGTPESLQGDTFTHVIFLGLQRRTRNELTPGGHCNHRGRRLVGLTRASHTLLVLGEHLYPAENPFTRRMQDLLQHSVNVDSQDKGYG